MAVDWKKHNELKDKADANAAAWATADEPTRKALHDENVSLYKQMDDISGSVSTYNPNTGSWSRDFSGSGITAGGGNGAYKSNYGNKISSLSRDIENSTFSYDPYSDPAYKAYAEMYQREGQRATKSTLADIATAQGGMSSFAGQAAQQAANYYSQQLNDRIPELMALAYQKYGADMDRKQNMLNTYLALDNQDYGRWVDDRNYKLTLDEIERQKAQRELENSWILEDRTIAAEDREIAKQQQAQADKDDAFNYVISAIQAGVPLGMLDGYLNRGGITYEQAGILRNQYLNSLKKNSSSVKSSKSSTKKKGVVDDDIIYEPTDYDYGEIPQVYTVPTKEAKAYSESAYNGKDFETEIEKIAQYVKDGVMTEREAARRLNEIKKTLNNAEGAK